jgi:TolB protein
LRKLWVVAIALLCAEAHGSTFSGTFVFVANPSGNWELFMLRSGEAPVQLTKTPLDERAPALAPDGKRVAYATSDGALWIMELASRKTSKVSLPKGVYGYPSWLPDGSGIVYTSYQYTPPQEDADLYLHVLKPASTRLLVLQTGPQDYAAIAPAGDRVAYVSSVATTLPGFGSTVSQQLWIASLRNGKPSQLFMGSSHDTSPAWSRDGRSLAFSSNRSGTPEIWIAAADGRGAQQLTKGPGAKTSPAWSPDGSQVAYISRASGRSRIEIFDVRSKTSRVLAVFDARPIDVRDPDWR